MRWLGPFVLVAHLSLGCGSSTAEAPTPAPPSAEPAAASEQPAPQAGTVTTGTFHSEALGVDKRYYLYLPAGYEDGDDKRYPVVYMLHGIGGSEDNWTKYMGFTEAADAMGLQAIAVMPDGDDSFYVNWPTEVSYDECMKGSRPIGRADDMATYCVKQANYEDYIARDLVAHVDATYRTIPKREARAIGGLSMGGYGALVVAMRNQDVFSSVASHSGVDALLYKGPRPYERGEVELFDDPSPIINQGNAFGAHFGRVFGPTIENWRAHDPAHLARELDDGDLALYLDCGTEDDFALQHGAAYLNEVLEQRGIDHAFALLPGRHDFAFWKDRIDDSLAFHVAHWREAGVYSAL